MSVRDRILAATSVKAEVVPVPEWGGDVYLRQLTLGEIEGWEHGNGVARTAGEPTRSISRLLAMALCDEAGEPIFSVEECDGLRPLKVVRRIARLVTDRTYPSPDDTEKNSGGGPTAASASPSPSPSAARSRSLRRP